ncbi:MAG: HAD-IB family hydrolase [Cystobacterineae bacterium]|nr:HAD-IB family hydrolase [Cystobacterineae bacterium]
MSVAFFDLDRTLISQNSALLWIQQQWKAGVLKRTSSIKTLGWFVRYNLGWGNSAAPLVQAMEGFAGVSHGEILEKTKKFYEEEVRRFYRPGALKELEEQQREGRECILLTSSTQYLGERVAADLGLDDCLANVLEVDAHGKLTGRIEGIVCYGHGKLLKAEAKLAQLNIALSECSFYTDSYADLPVMEAIGNPVAVNADLRLRRWAKKHGHPIVDWGR